MGWVSRNDRPLRSREEIARIVHTVSLRRGLDELATVIALMTIAVEVGVDGHWWCPWNAKDPTSKNYQHDSQSDDGRSVGYFQQQNGAPGETVSGSDNWWGPMQSRMTLEEAADTFLSRLTNDWRRAKDNPVLAGQFAQDVQGSGFGGRYKDHWTEAWEVLRRALAEQPITAATETSRPTGETMGFTGDPVWLEDVLREALGDRLVVEDGWARRGTGGFMGDIWGVMIHHTGNINETVGNIRDGVQQDTGFLPGPLSQCLITPDGKCHLIAVGPCNHAGKGFYEGVGTNNGNQRLIGFECSWPTPRPDLEPPYDPNENWSTPQIITMRDATAAVLKRLGHGSDHVIGHKEWAGSTQRKWDPGNLSMTWFRGEVQRDIDGEVFAGETLQEAPQPDPRPVGPPILPAEPNTRTERQLLEEIWDQLRGPGGNGWPQLGDRTVVDFLTDLSRLAVDLRSQLDDLREKVESLHNGPCGGETKKAAAKKAPVKRAASNSAVAKKAPAKKTP